MTGDSRPNPDDLLKAVTRHESDRGRLKVFLGASAGVGKTYAMLSSAHEERKRGVDVVIGYIECHDRAETRAMVADLEQVPLAEIEYKGATLRELDVDAVIARKPKVALVDELAHTNAPGARHAKRWQDIDELLDAGIDVFTAVNIQHLESLNDVVAQVTGVRVHETVPDAFLDRADELELIDLAPAELQQRLREGKVYANERVQTALDGFFKTSNLTALRELALRRTADTVDAEMQRLRVEEGVRSPWTTRDRIVVCIAPNRMATKVVRAAARLGAPSHAELIAVYVESDRQISRSSEEHAAAQEALSLAESLGMEVVNLHGHDIVSELVGYANRRNASLIVVGKPIRPRWREILSGSVVDEIVRASGDIDVHVLTFDPKGARAERPKVVSADAAITWPGTALVIAANVIATAIGFALFEGFGVANIAMVYLLAVSAAAIRCTRLESVVASTLGVLCFDFFFVSPRFTFAISDTKYALVFLVMMAVGLVISTLTHRLRSQLEASAERERRTASLYTLSRKLAQGRGKREMARAATKEIRDVFDGDASVSMVHNGKVSLLAPSESGFENSPNEQAVARWVLDHAEPAGLGTDTLPGAEALYIPLCGAESTVGVLGFKPHHELSGFAQRQHLDTFANALGLALERTIVAKESNEAKIFAESERVRSTLLSSISHDLRTPLTSITGSASALAARSGGEEKALAETIYSEAIRLNSQITNLLDMTRLQSGGVQLDLKWHSAEDLIASALRATQAILGARGVRVILDPEVPLLKVDGLLIEKAIANLLENAGRHTGPNDPVKIHALIEGDRVAIRVKDSGPGLQSADLDALFKPGYRTPGGGYGLGLALVKTVMDLHGGEVAASNGESGGAVFTLLLPKPAEPPPEAPVG